jgi:hypothetical protein
MSLGPTLEIGGLSGHPASAPSGRSAALACNPLGRQIGGLLVGGGPAGQQCERVGGRGGRLGGYDPVDPIPAVGGRVINPVIGGYRDNRELEKRDDVLTFTGPR